MGMGSRGKQGAGAVLWFHEHQGAGQDAAGMRLTRIMASILIPIMPYKDQIICLLMGHDCTSEG